MSKTDETLNNIRIQPQQVKIVKNYNIPSYIDKTTTSPPPTKKRKFVRVDEHN